MPPPLTCRYGFLTFVDLANAVAFWEAGQRGAVFMHQQRVNLNWAKAQPLAPDVGAAVQNGATRFLHVGNISETTTERQLSMVSVASWRCHGRLPSARQAASEGVGPPSALVRSDPSAQIPPRGRGRGATPH